MAPHGRARATWSARLHMRDATQPRASADLPAAADAASCAELPRVARSTTRSLDAADPGIRRPHPPATGPRLACRAIHSLIALLVGGPPKRTTSSGRSAPRHAASRSSRSAPCITVPPRRVPARKPGCRIGDHRPSERGGQRRGGGPSAGSHVSGPKRSTPRVDARAVRAPAVRACSRGPTPASAAWHRCGPSALRDAGASDVRCRQQRLRNGRLRCTGPGIGPGRLADRAAPERPCIAPSPRARPDTAPPRSSA